jgi:hypothetical protein
VDDVVRNLTERKGSVASMVRMREAMRLDFYQWLFLRRQREIDREVGGERGTAWDVRGLWKKLVGVKENASKEQGLPKNRFKIRKVQGLLVRV